MRLQTIFWKEDDTYILKEVSTGVTTQGFTIEEALTNIKEAVNLYLEEMPDIKNTIQNMDIIGMSSVEIP